MKKLLLLFLSVALLSAMAVADASAAGKVSSSITLIGTVKDKLTGRQLPRANAVLYNSKGEEVCKVSCNVGYKINGEDASRYIIPVSLSRQE